MASLAPSGNRERRPPGRQAAIEARSRVLLASRNSSPGGCLSRRYPEADDLWYRTAVAAMVVVVEGVGLHTGLPVRVQCIPSDDDARLSVSARRADNGSCCRFDGMASRGGVP